MKILCKSGGQTGIALHCWMSLMYSLIEDSRTLRFVFGLLRDCIPLYARRSHRMLVRDQRLSGTWGVLCPCCPLEGFQRPSCPRKHTAWVRSADGIIKFFFLTVLNFPCWVNLGDTLKGAKQCIARLF